MAKRKSKVVHGDDLLYRFFASLIDDRFDFATELLSRMYTTMGIWLPLEVYQRLPVLLPWVVRDNSCRGNKAKGIPDQWGEPNSKGYFRDDNSLVKAIPRSLVVSAMAMPHLNQARMGTDFVAAHIWRVGKDGQLVSRNPLLNSFVPNLVWLPAQVAKLTDREGSIMQIALQAIAWARYRDVPVKESLRGTVEQAWSELPQPKLMLPTTQEFNEFVSTDRFIKTREEKIGIVIDALEAISAGKSLTRKIISTRYTDGLPSIDPGSRDELLTFLRKLLPNPVSDIHGSAAPTATSILPG